MYGSLGFAIFLLILGISLKIHYFNILTNPIAAIAILLIGALTPYGFYEYSQGQRIIEMERRLPDLLRDIAILILLGIMFGPLLGIISNSFSIYLMSEFGTVGVGLLGIVIILYSESLHYGEFQYYYT